MTGETLGTARVDLVVNTDQFVAGVSAMNKSLEGMGKASQSAAKQVADNIAKTNAAAKTVSASANASTSAIEQNSKRQIASLQKQIAFLGASREEQLRWIIAQRTSGETAALLNKQLDAQVAKLKQTTNALGGSGKSAKELQFALRGLPAQITDIVTGIASGQRPLTILLQQGGQLKDMFGGIVPAARALGGAIVDLVNPLTITAGVVLGLAVAWDKAEQRMAAFRQALDLTGNAVGLTTDDLEAMAARLDSTTSATQGKASEVLAQVAATGKFTRDQIEQVAQAAIELEAATGRSIKQTVADFASLKDDPLDAILKLNDAMGDGTNVIRFLRPEQIKLIEQYKEQGNQAGATKVAVDALYDAIHTRAPQAVADVGLLEGSWRGLKHSVSEAFDGIINGFGRADKAAKHGLETISGYINALQNTGPAALFGFQQASTSQSSLTAARTPAKPGTIVNSAEEREAIAFKDRYLTREETKKRAIAELDRLRSHYTAEEYATLKKGIEERFKPPKAAKPVNLEPATNRQNIQALEDGLKKEQGLIANQTQVLEANYAARNISAEKYYAEQKRLAQENTDVQVKALEGEIAVLQSRNVKGKISIENATELAQKEAALAKVRADGAAAQKVLNIQEDANNKQRQQALKSYGDALKETEIAQQDEIDNQILRLSVGEREYQQRTRIIELRRQEAKELRDLARQKTLDPVNADVYEQQAKLVEESFDRQVRAAQRGYDLMTKAQQDWASGALKAFADYKDAANDVSGQTYSIFSDALHGLEDVLTDFFTKGKADWKGFFDGIAAEITRFVIRQQLNKLIKKFIPGMADDGQASNADALKGAASNLAASAGPLYGAAAALNASAAALAAAGAGGGGGGLTGASSGSGGGWLSSLFSSFFSGGGEQWYAKGGAFNAGREVKAFAYGGVVGSPTYFPMADGKMGLMGEERPEAIMPLKRGPDGRLGVVAQVPRDHRPMGPAVVNQTLVLQGRPDSRTPDQYAQAAARGQNRVTARNR